MAVVLGRVVGDESAGPARDVILPTATEVIMATWRWSWMGFNGFAFFCWKVAGVQELCESGKCLTIYDYMITVNTNDSDSDKVSHTARFPGPGTPLPARSDAGALPWFAHAVGSTPE